MCLQRISERKVATEDIVCYKYIREQMVLKNKLKHGDSFTGKINGINCQGKVSINKVGGVYFCTNDYMLDGMDTDDKLEYSYSCAMDDSVEEIRVNGENALKLGYVTPYTNAVAEIGAVYYSEITVKGNEIHRALHSFKHLSDAAISRDADLKSPIMRLVECVIPKGSVYYEGTFAIYQGYASDTLKYVKLVEGDNNEKGNHLPDA